MCCHMVRQDIDTNLLLVHYDSPQTTVGDAWAAELGCASGPAAPVPVACVELPADKLAAG
jgi:hypothetical protein